MNSSASDVVIIITCGFSQPEYDQSFWETFFSRLSFVPQHERINHRHHCFPFPHHHHRFILFEGVGSFMEFSFAHFPSAAANRENLAQI